MSLRIRSDGTIQVEREDTDINYWEDISPNVVLSYLSDTIELDKKFTLKSYFLMLKKYQALMLLDDWLTPFMDTYDSITKPSKTIDTLVVSRVFEYEKSGTIFIDDISDDANGLREEETLYILNNNVTFNDNKSIGSYVHISGKCDNDNETYSISFNNLEELILSKIELSDTGILCITDPKNTSRENEIVEIDYFTLFEFVTEIIAELSFFGVDEEKAEKLDTIISEIEELKKKIDKEEGDKEDE